MALYHQTDGRELAEDWTTRPERRASVGMSILLIAGCSALLWASLISIGMVLSRLL
jgi:hypothetical protein